jgi:poly(A) polymerase
MVSAALAEAAMRRLRRPENFVARVADLIRWHLRPGALASPPAADRPVRRLAREAGASLGLLLCLALADRRASGAADSKERERALIHLGDRALSAAAVAAHRRGEPPLLDGYDVMRLLSIPHGPRVGAILRWLERERLDGVIRTREEAEALLQSLPPPRIQD